MAFSERSLDDYVDVAQRIADFRALYPSGSLQPADPASPWEVATVTGYDKGGEQQAQTFIVYIAAAYRTPDDTRPGIGAAWEIWPGRTPYTRGSELMNAETSAWGRAIVAVLASDSKAGVASRQEVAARRAEREDGLPTNRDGSLSRSQTTDAQKDAAGVMTAAQQAEHTALQPKAAETRGKVTRIRAGGAPAPTPRSNAPVTAGGASRCHECGMIGGHHVTCPHRKEDTSLRDPWLDQPAGHLDVEQEDRPGTIDGRQQRAIMKRYEGWERATRLAEVSRLAGREVTSTNDLSMTEAAKVLKAGAK